MKLKRCLALVVLAALLASDALAEGPVLRVFGKGGAGDLENPLFAQMYPDVAWEGSDRLGVNDASDLVTVLLTKEAYDLYAIPYAACRFEAVMQKKYALDLSADPTIAERCGQLYPFIQDAIMAQGAIYGIPISLSCSQWGYSPDAWRTVQEAFPVQLPQTYGELFAFMDWWISEGQYEFPGIQLAKSIPDYKLAITQNLTDDLLDIMWKHQSPELLSDPAIVGLYGMLENLPFDQLQPPIANDGGDDVLYLLDAALDWLTLDEYPDEAVYLPLPLALSTDRPIEIPVEMRLFFVNPASQWPQEAIGYLSCFLADMDERFAIIAYDAPHEPVLNPWLSNVLEAARQELASIEDAEAPDQAMRVEALSSRIAVLEQHQWLVSPERIEAYRALVPLLFIRPYHPLSSSAEGSGNMIDSYVQSFVQDRISAEKCLQSISDTVRMVMEENERRYE